MLIGVKQTGQGTRPIAKLEQCPSQRGRGKQRANSCGVFTLTVPVILRKEQLASQKHPHRRGSDECGNEFALVMYS